MELKITNFIKVEPYWNVNHTHLITDEGTHGIKVEPYWNVNQFGIQLQQFVQMD